MEVNIKNYKTCRMKTFNITITSKNKNSVNNFYLFFNQNLTVKTIKKYFQKKKKRRRLTILTSPHVNKTAQEHFENKLFRKQFTIKTTKKFKYLIFFKKLTANLFPDVSVKLKHIINNKDMKIIGLKIFNPNHYKINKYSNFEEREARKINLKKKTNIILKIFDLYGELSKNMSE